MLPDYPDLKRDLDAFLMRFLKARAAAHEGFVGEISQHAIHEGDQNSIVREDGTEDQTEMTAIEHILELSWYDLAHMQFRDVLKRMDKIAEEMAAQKSEYVFKTLNEVVEQTGNVVDAGGRKLTAEVFLEALSKIQLDFDDEGKPNEASFVVGPSQVESVKQAIQKFEGDPELQKKHQTIMQQKKGDWRAREAARALVG